MSAAPAPVLMHAQPGGQASTPTLTVTKAARALHIDQRILDQPGLSLTACAILAEVLDLYQVKGKVFADDDHFGARAKCSARTARGELATLEKAGYLNRDVDQRRNGNKRLLVPTDKWKEIPIAPAEFAGATPEPPANSATASGENCRNLRQNLPQAPADSANINTILNTTTNTILNTTPPADAGGAGFGKKIGEKHPADLPAADEQIVPPVARPPRAKPTKPKPVPVAAELLPDTCPLAELLNPGGDAALVQQLAQPLSEAQAEKLLVGYGFEQVADILRQMANWKKLLISATSAYLTADNWLRKRAKEAATQVLTTHATPNQPSYSPRPANGAKPTGNAGQLARALSRQLRD